jgi:hypothetical protein
MTTVALGCTLWLTTIPLRAQDPDTVASHELRASPLGTADLNGAPDFGGLTTALLGTHGAPAGDGAAKATSEPSEKTKMIIGELKFNLNGVANYIKGSLGAESVEIEELERLDMSLGKKLSRLDQRFQEKMYDNPLGRWWRKYTETDDSRAIVDTTTMRPIRARFVAKETVTPHHDRLVVNCVLVDWAYAQKVWVNDCTALAANGTEIDFGFPRDSACWVLSYSELNSEALKDDPRTSSIGMVYSFRLERQSGFSIFSQQRNQQRRRAEGQPETEE